ncbi:protein ARV1 [Phymastichus coffea]|uniref:protein ARV1 n=1 Tax=Phymastichus coffea TaxID=108790 RepID=UPI00273A7F5B|nr:protein ARV1 [Phymastichus coffea]
MYTCINCGAQVDELYRRYSPSVLKVVKCENCGNLADKYIEYDPVIVLVDLVLLEKPAYRHLLYNSDFNAYWKLMIVLILGESYRIWSSYENSEMSTAVNYLDSVFALFDHTNHGSTFQSERNFYFLLCHTTLSLAVFACVVLLITELRWLLLGKRPPRYQPLDLVRALVVGGCAKLLGLLGIIWQHVTPELHNLIIYGYTVLCLLTAYSVVCDSGRTGSLIGLIGGLLAHNYVYNVIPELYLSTANMTMLQT